MKHERHTYDFYQEELMRISHQVQDLAKEFLVGCFISGSRNAIKYDVVAKNPTTMMEAMRLAQVEEEKLLNIRRGSKVAFQKGGSPPNSTRSTTTLRGFIVGPPHTANNPVKRLTPQEIREQRDKGLCFYCDERYVAGHSVNRKKFCAWISFQS